MDRLKAIETFVEIVHAGSFSAAARKLHTSRAMASRHVQQLEEHLGAQLFNRTTRQLSLTEIGEEYFASCRKILAELADADLTASQLQAEPRGTLKITAPNSFGNLCLSPIIAEFLLTYPDITVSLALRSATFNAIDVADAGFDIVILLATKLEDTSLIARKLGEDHWIPCASPAYLKRHGVPQKPEDLAQHNCLLTREQSVDRWNFHSASGSQAVRVSGSLTGNVIAARAAAVAGAGIALLPTYCVGPDLAEGRLIRVCPGYGTDGRTLYALYPPGRYTPRKVRSFLDLMTRRLTALAASIPLPAVVKAG